MRAKAGPVRRLLLTILGQTCAMLNHSLVSSFVFEQIWSMVGSVVPPSPPGKNCTELGCDIAWDPALPCQCNKNCAQVIAMPY